MESILTSLDATVSSLPIFLELDFTPKRVFDDNYMENFSLNRPASSQFDITTFQGLRPASTASNKRGASSQLQAYL